MTESSNDSLAAKPHCTVHRGLRWGGVVFALVFPTVITWGYFVLAGRYSTGTQQATYLVVKSIQFAFPLIWLLFVLREPTGSGLFFDWTLGNSNNFASRKRIPTPLPPTPRGLVLGALFSVFVVAAGWLLFDRVLRDAEAFAGAAALIHEKIGGFGIDSAWKYIILAAFYSLFHSLLEEYYWRWFVFRQLRQLVPLWPAVVVSALGFMGHHVVVLGQFFQDAPWLACLFASAVAVGGAFWAWLYERTGSLFGPWLSHLLIDAGIFWVGYDLVRGAMSGGG